MKKIMITVITLTSLTAMADYDKTCARRYIKASKALVQTAKDYNNAEIGGGKYAAEVMATVAEINATRVFCASENRPAQECVKNTKPVYQKIRSKMYVNEVLKGNVNSIEVSDLDLIALAKASVKGFFKKVLRGEDENICRVNDDY